MRDKIKKILQTDFPFHALAIAVSGFLEHDVQDLITLL